MPELLRLKPKDKFKELDFLLDVATWENHGDYPSHVHDFSKIAIVMQGSGTAEIDGEMIPFHKGDVFVMHGNLPNSYVNTRNLTITNVLFSSSLIDLGAFEPGLLPGYQALFVVSPALRSAEGYDRHLTLTVDQLIKIKVLTDMMEEEPRLKNPGYRLMAVGHFMILVTILSRYYSESETQQTHYALQLGNALSYLEEHYTEEIDINMLAKMFGMSLRNFFRIFPRITGTTPLAYQNKLRIMKAVKLLELTDEKVTGIAYECGFQDSNYFSRQFKKVMGMPPTEFRRKYHRVG